MVGALTRGCVRAGGRMQEAVSAQYCAYLELMASARSALKG